MSLLTNATIKVSSVLNKDVKQFGKKYLTDQSLETCWNSHTGNNQFIHVDFPSQLYIHSLQLTFQGGFAGKDCEIWAKRDGELEKCRDFYPDDTNKPQEFPVDVECSSIRILFKTSTDFYGRITVYHFDLV